MIRRRKNQFLAACLAILGLAYLHFGLFPGPLKSYPLKWIENESPYPIEFGRILYLPIWGTRIDDVYIHLGDGLPPASFKSIRLKTDLFSFIRESKIVINKLFLHKPKKHSSRLHFNTSTHKTSIVLKTPALPPLTGSYP